jgi:GNAT superfamily N-acetyltransferase
VTDPSIRVASPSEHELLADIQERASVAALAHIFDPHAYPFPRQEVRTRWATFDGRALIAEVDGRAVGFVGVSAPWLDGLYVIPDTWGTGVASRLHDRALAMLQAEGCAEALLWVLEHNGRARRFYERHGWLPDGATRVVPYPPHPIDVRYSVALAQWDNPA